MSVECATITFSTCGVPAMEDYCSLPYLKTTLKPIQITGSTAKLEFLVPRQSIFDHPYKTGWTLSVTRGGSSELIAEYMIETYDTSRQMATFFIDDKVRNAKKGVYVAQVKQGCCVVAKVQLYIDCARAESVGAVDFTHDPFTGCDSTLIPRPAESCEVRCDTSPPACGCTAVLCHCNAPAPFPLPSFYTVKPNACTDKPAN